jgi:D-serine deaminase-like pyridoxal phosphate-dependent protein
MNDQRRKSYPNLCVDRIKSMSNLKQLVDATDQRCRVRLATKSIRCPQLLRLFLDSLADRASGLMCYHPNEIEFLHQAGFDNILLAYPNYASGIASKLAAHQANIDGGAQKQYLMADLPEHVQILGEAAKSHDTRLDVILDIDVSTPLLGIHFGVHRSSIITAEQLMRMISEVVNHPHLNLCGLMSYEAQIAGIADRDPRENWVIAAFQRLLKKISKNRIYDYRARLHERLQNELPLDDPNFILNGGGSGSVASSSRSPLVNEVTMGSGILCPSLFENYDHLNLEPAIFYSTPVVRKPQNRIRTVYSGGYVSSGSISGTKQPKILYPKGWNYTATEGGGEVQTPLLMSKNTKTDLQLGDQVFFSPAKSGEVMERFVELQYGDFDDQMKGSDLQSFLTYRGLGVCFG